MSRKNRSNAKASKFYGSLLYKNERPLAQTSDEDGTDNLNGLRLDKMQKKLKKAYETIDMLSEEVAALRKTIEHTEHDKQIIVLAKPNGSQVEIVYDSDSEHDASEVSMKSAEETIKETELEYENTEVRPEPSILNQGKEQPADITIPVPSEASEEVQKKRLIYKFVVVKDNKYDNDLEEAVRNWRVFTVPTSAPAVRTNAKEEMDLKKETETQDIEAEASLDTCQASASTNTVKQSTEMELESASVINDEDTESSNILLDILSIPSPPTVSVQELQSKPAIISKPKDTLNRDANITTQDQFESIMITIDRKKLIIKPLKPFSLKSIILAEPKTPQPVASSTSPEDPIKKKEVDHMEPGKLIEKKRHIDRSKLAGNLNSEQRRKKSKPNPMQKMPGESSAKGNAQERTPRKDGSLNKKAKSAKKITKGDDGAQNSVDNHQATSAKKVKRKRELKGKDN